MAFPIKVKYLPESEKWVVLETGSIVKTFNKKAQAKKKAVGMAQTKADNDGVTQVVEYYNSRNQYKGNQKVSPAP